MVVSNELKGTPDSAVESYHITVKQLCVCRVCRVCVCACVCVCVCVCVCYFRLFFARVLATDDNALGKKVLVFDALLVTQLNNPLISMADILSKQWESAPTNVDDAELSVFPFVGYFAVPIHSPAVRVGLCITVFMFLCVLC